MRTLTSLATVAAVGILAGCSGTGGSAVAPRTITPTSPAGAPVSPNAKTAHVLAKIFFPKAKKTAKLAGRHRQYVSPDTAGLVIEVDTVAGGTPSQYSLTGYDLTQNTANSTCTPVTGGTSCAFTFDAPVTSSDSSDAFSIYAYDAAQTVGPVTASYVPAGDLLSQDASDPVPSPANPGVVVNANNALSFVLKPVVFAPVASIGGVTASVSAPLVLSVSGNGGASNNAAVDGYDAGDGKTGNAIASYLAGNDDTYVNPIAVTASSSDFTPSTASLTSALDDSVGVTWSASGAAANQPADASSTPYSGTLTATSSLTSGGFQGTETFAPVATSVTVAPLFAITAAGSAQSGSTANTVDVYALQAAVPTGQSAANYSIAPAAASTTNDCTGFSAGDPITTGLSGAQRAMWSITVPSSGTTGQSCSFAISDGLSTTTVAALTPTSGNGTIVIPGKPSGNVVQQMSVAAQPANQLFQMNVQNPGDLLFCYFSDANGSSGNFSGDANYYFSYDTHDFGATTPGLVAFGVDTLQAGDFISIQGDGVDSIWCGEFAGFAVADIVPSAVGGDSSQGGFMSDSATTPAIAPSAPGSIVVTGLSGVDTTPYTTSAGYTQYAELSDQGSLDVQVRNAATTSAETSISNTFGGGDGAPSVSGISLLTPNGGPSSQARHARAFKLSHRGSVSTRPVR